MKITDKHHEIMWLCFRCPEVEPNQNCVLQKYRNEIISGETDLLEELSAVEVNILIEAHEKCLQKRKNKKTHERHQVI